MDEKLLNQYRQSLADHLQTEPSAISLAWKGRVSLYGLLKALGVGPGAEVILPAFTCVVVPNAILYLGGCPVYAEVDPATCNLTPQTVRSKITEKTKVIIAQNTFGLTPDLDGLAELSAEFGVALLEDCTHGFGGTYKGRPNGTVADAAFFSTQWNKPFSTGIGGFALCKPEALRQAMQTFERELSPPSIRRCLGLKAQIWARKHLLRPGIYWTALRLYRWLSYKGWVTGSSEGSELSGSHQPEGYLQGLCAVQASEGIRQLNRWTENLYHRRAVAKIWEKALDDLGIGTPQVPTYAGHSYLKVPLLVKDRTTFFTLAEKEKIRLGDWMLSPIHPIQENYRNWNYTYGQFPVGEFLSRHIVNLPTDPDVGEKEIQRILKFLHANKHRLLPFPQSMEDMQILLREE
jgi:perosamine synthetase